MTAAMSSSQRFRIDRVGADAVSGASATASVAIWSLDTLPPHTGARP
jgi:hypothetical protein